MPYEFGCTSPALFPASSTISYIVQLKIDFKAVSMQSFTASTAHGKSPASTAKPGIQPATPFHDRSSPPAAR
jgi:hypothetical protein